MGRSHETSHYIKIYLKTPAMTWDVETKIPLRIGFRPAAQRVHQASTVEAQIFLAPPPPAPSDDMSPTPFCVCRAVTSGFSGVTHDDSPRMCNCPATAYDPSLSASVYFTDLIPVPPPRVPSVQVLLEVCQ